ncbi:hypothetical protein ES703_69104 [subsurface metagenome]
MAGSVMGGTSYAISIGVAQAAKRQFKAEGRSVSFTIEESIGNVDNVVRMVGGFADLGVCDTQHLTLALEGKGEYAVRENDMVMLARLRPDLYAILEGTLDTTGWTFRDLEGLPVSLQVKGTTAYSIIKPVLDVLGIEVIERNMSHAEGGEALLEGTIFGHMGATYTPGLDLVYARKGIWVMAPHPDDISIILEKLPYFLPMTFNASQTPWKANDVDTVGVYMILACTADMPDDLAYSITKGLFSNTEMMAASYAPLKDIVPADILLATIENSIHPGAAKFYKEQGVNILDKYIYKK